MSCPEATLRWWLSGTQGSTSGKFEMLPLPVQDGCIYEAREASDTARPSEVYKYTCNVGGKGRPGWQRLLVEEKHRRQQ